MRRLWVRTSLAISGVFLALLIIPTLILLILSVVFEAPAYQGDDNAAPSNPSGAVIEESREYDEHEWRDWEGERPPRGRDFVRSIPRIFLQGALVIGLFGMGAGIVVGRIMTTPITQLAQAANTIGQGDFSHRLTLKGSQEIEQLAHSFNQMAADLEQAETVRRNLMADVSHELRTPLTVLEGNLRAALDHVYELDDEELANLYSQTHHLIRLVNDLHELTLAEARRLPLDIRPTNLMQLVEETLAIFEPLAEEKEVRLVRDVPDTAVTLEIDDVRIRQVLHNLISNALRHTPAGGEIKLTVDVLTDVIRVRVADTGEGIEPEFVEHIFDRFYRTDRSRSRDTGGTGLGLAIVKAIVEAHGGYVTATSAGLGQGSQFSLLLPKGS
ncbi:MAG: HAMP domain-containing protein [Anaerolineales bacterium]|nr:HAMP domain-containing protein [Anaerolineales bacterium]